LGLHGGQTNPREEGRVHAQAEVLRNADLRKLDKIKVYSPTAGHAQAFAERWTEKSGVESVPMRSAKEAAQGADFDITATNAPEPVVLKDEKYIP
jgi:ornithine cyclodeaminase/alanine dehydrogenase-like protein (mu-crystallin family)